MTVTLSGGATKLVSLPINPAPDPAAPMIANYQALQGFDASNPLLIQWNAFTGAGVTDAIQLKLIEQGGLTAYIAPNRCEGIELNPTDTSHTVAAGRLRPGVTYDLEITFTKTTHLHEADDSPSSPPDHIRNFAEFGLLSKTTRLTIGAPITESGLEFTRIFMDENGYVSMEVSGTLATPANFGIIQGTQNFSDWSDTGITISKAGLEAVAGTIIVQDPLFLTTPLPYRFYRIVTH